MLFHIKLFLFIQTFRLNHGDNDGLSDDEIVWKATGVLAGVLIFYLLESVLQILMDTIKKKNGKLKLQTEKQKIEEDKSPLLDVSISSKYG